MPKLYCRVNLRTDLQKRDRAGLRFNRDWTELDNVDEATLAALNEDPYLEVSDTPTVLVEVAATVQTAQEHEGITDEQNSPAGGSVDDAAIDTANADISTAQKQAELSAAETTDKAEEVVDAEAKTGKKSKKAAD